MTEPNAAAKPLSKAGKKLRAMRRRRALETEKRLLAEERIRAARAERRAKAEELKTAQWWPRTTQHNPGWESIRESLTSRRDTQAQLLEAKKLGKDIPEGNFLWDWTSGYQDLIDRLRSPDGLLLSAISIAADRKYGANWPFFRTWQDLALLRGASRILYQTSALARGAIGAVASYIVGDGFKYRCTTKNDVSAPGLAASCQDILDEDSRLNNWPLKEAACVMRDSRDGEWYLRAFARDNGTTAWRWVEPEQLIQPSDSTLEEWSFGKQNPIGEAYDVQTVLAYNVCYDGISTPQNSEVVPESEMIGHVANVDETVKRGIPDLAYDTYSFLKVAGRLIENMAEGSAIQAAVSEIIQWDSPVTSDQANDFAAADADYQVTDPWTGSQQNVRAVRPGETRHIPKGATYVPPPFSQGSPVYIQVEQAVLRAVAVTWNAPEWLTSGDSSNNNYASSLTAESPFVKTGSQKQNVHYKPRFVAARWITLRNYCEAKGGITANGRKYSWEEVQQYIDIQCEPPSMEVRNRADEAQANAVRVQSGWKSRQTVAQEEGLDWDQEQRNIEEYNDAMGQQGPPLPMPSDDDQSGGFGAGDRLPGLEQIILEDGFSGEKKDKRGRRMCYANGKRVPCPKRAAEKKAAAPKPSVDDVAKRIADARSKGLTHEALQEIAGHMSKLTVKELGQLKQKLNIKASGAKAELAKKILERATAHADKPTAAPAKPAPTGGGDVKDHAKAISQSVDAAVAALRATKDRMKGKSFPAEGDAVIKVAVKHEQEIKKLFDDLTPQIKTGAQATALAKELGYPLVKGSKDAVMRELRRRTLAHIGNFIRPYA